MDVISACPLRVASVVWQPRPGAWTLTVACKATYRLEPICSPLADVQDEVVEEDSHWDDDESRSLQAASDLSPVKPRADVLLVGHAFAPEGQPVRSLTARLRVGAMEKAIEVWCDRAFAQDGRLLEGKRFTKVPLRWERAAGGPDTSNPVGMRFDAEPDMYGRVLIPNLQPPGQHVAWRGDTFEPTGCGPIAPAWPGRAGKLYGHAAGWFHRHWAERALPEGIDVGYFNAAPMDQQVAQLRADEQIILENLHPDHARLVTNLAGVRPWALVERSGGAQDELRIVPDTLCVDTDRGVATLTWRGSLDLQHPREAGRVVLWMDGEVVVMGGAPSEADEEEIRTLVPPAMTKGAWVGRQGEEEVAVDGGTMVAPQEEGSREPVLPFEARSDASVLAAPSAESVGRRMDARIGRTKSAPPGAVDDAVIATATAQLVMSAQDPLPFQRTFARDQERVGTVAAGPASADERMATLTPQKDLQLPLPPPMIGPLATPAMMAQASPQVSHRAELSASVEPASGPLQEAEPASNPADFPLETCAAITAMLARRREEKGRVLDEHRLTSAHWAAIERYWTEEIRAETMRGRPALLARFDAAYVEQLEKDRGPIKVEDYVRLVLAAERGTLEEALHELDLPRGAVMRIERVWLQRSLTDAALDETTRDMLTHARDQPQGQQILGSGE